VVVVVEEVRFCVVVASMGGRRERKRDPLVAADPPI